MNKQESKLSWTKVVLAISLLLMSALFVGCIPTAIEDVTTDENVGNTITVRGTVENTVKIGELSGYTLKDDTGSIRVSSESLPTEGTKKTVSGTLMKDTLFGYYIKVN